jgi:serine/threonine protein kinase
MPLDPGMPIGPYEIVAFLGAGGTGEVYQAQDPRLAIPVGLIAVKRAPGRVTDLEAIAELEVIREERDDAAHRRDG